MKKNPTILICKHAVGGTLNTNYIPEAGLYELRPTGSKNPRYTIEKIEDYPEDEECPHKNWGCTCPNNLEISPDCPVLKSKLFKK